MTVHIFHEYYNNSRIYLCGALYTYIYSYCRTPSYIETVYDFIPIFLYTTNIYTRHHHHHIYSKQFMSFSKYPHRMLNMQNFHLINTNEVTLARPYSAHERNNIPVCVYFYIFLLNISLYMHAVSYSIGHYCIKCRLWIV